MKKLRDFKCDDCGKTFEAFVIDSIKQGKCDCGGTANRKINAARYFYNTIGKSPSASNKK